MKHLFEGKWCFLDLRRDSDLLFGMQTVIIVFKWLIMTHASLHSRYSKEQDGTVGKERLRQRKTIKPNFVRNGHVDRYVGTNTEIL